MILAGEAFTTQGKKLLAQIMGMMGKCGHERLSDMEVSASENGLSTRVAHYFEHAQGIVFVGACGIAVRAIAPHLHSKASDPAVVVVDEKGQWVISLLSGHIGGANKLTLEIADAIDANPIITTATDQNDLFAVDVWAMRNNLNLQDITKVKRVSSSLLDGKTVFFASEVAVIGSVPKELTQAPGHAQDFLQAYVDRDMKESLIIISPRILDAAKRSSVMHLIPRSIYLGVGCRRNTEANKIAQAVDKALELSGISEKGVAAVATITLKASEPGLLAFCAEQHWPLETFSARELIEAKGSFVSSEFVRDTTGVDNVCERAASLASSQGRQLLGKTAFDGVTVAVYEKNVSVGFE